MAHVASESGDPSTVLRRFAPLRRLGGRSFAGARGYYAMNGDPAALCRAVEVVRKGGIWGPREALALLARAPVEQDELEPQQRAVLQLLRDGLTNKEIGQRLGLAEATIKSRMNRLYRRFGVSSRLQLLSAAIRRGIVQVRRE